MCLYNPAAVIVAGSAAELRLERLGLIDGLRQKARLENDGDAPVIRVLAHQLRRRRASSPENSLSTHQRRWRITSVLASHFVDNKDLVLAFAVQIPAHRGQGRRASSAPSPSSLP